MYNIIINEIDNDNKMILFSLFLDILRYVKIKPIIDPKLAIMVRINALIIRFTIKFYYQDFLIMKLYLWLILLMGGKKMQNSKNKNSKSNCNSKNAKNKRNSKNNASSMNSKNNME